MRPGRRRMLFRCARPWLIRKTGEVSDVAHEVGAQEKITYGRNDRFSGGPVGGGRFWVDDDGRSVAKLGGPAEWRRTGMIDVRIGDTFTVGGQTWKVTEIVDAESPDAYLITTRVS